MRFRVAVDAENVCRRPAPLLALLAVLNPDEATVTAVGAEYSFDHLTRRRFPPKWVDTVDWRPTGPELEAADTVIHELVRGWAESPGPIAIVSSDGGFASALVAAAQRDIPAFLLACDTPAGHLRDRVTVIDLRDPHGPRHAAEVLRRAATTPPHK